MAVGYSYLFDDNLQFYRRGLRICLQQISPAKMSIFFNIGRSTTPDFVQLDSEFITVKNLKTLVSRKIGVREQDMKIRNVITFVEYAPNEYIKKGSSVSVDIAVRNLVDEPLKFHEIISNQRLEAMMDDCRFYVVKSSNEDNVQKARDCSVWATTFPNQDKFKTSFQCYKHVFILFGTNRSFELKGLARMESEPDKIPDKSIWNGVSNIRLGGNFKIRWIRKKPLSLTTIEKKLGVEAREEMSKATDGYEPDKEIAKRVALLFEPPSEPYYKLDELSESKKQVGIAGKLNLGLISRQNEMFTSQLASVMMKNLQESSRIDQLGISDDIPKPVIMRPQVIESKEDQSDSQSERRRRKAKKEKKSKKKRSKKQKSGKKRRQGGSSRSSRSRSRSRSQDESSSSGEVRRGRQGCLQTQKQNN